MFQFLTTVKRLPRSPLTMPAIVSIGIQIQRERTYIQQQSGREPSGWFQPMAQGRESAALSWSASEKVQRRPVASGWFQPAASGRELVFHRAQVTSEIAIGREPSGCFQPRAYGWDSVVEFAKDAVRGQPNRDNQFQQRPFRTACWCRISICHRGWSSGDCIRFRTTRLRAERVHEERKPFSL